MFVGPPFHAMPYARHVDYSASSIFINLTDTRKWFGKEKAQWHLNPRVQDKHKGKDGARALPLPSACSARVYLLACICVRLSTWIRDVKARSHIMCKSSQLYYV